MTETLQQQVVIQPTLQSTATTNRDENLFNRIRRISIAVIIISVICFLSGIANSVIFSLIWISLWHAVWCPLLPFVAGILGLNSKSSMLNGVFISFSMVGTISSIVMIALESWFVNVPRNRRWFWASYVLGFLIIICGCVLTILLIILAALGFMRCSCFNSKKKTKQVVYVQSSNVQQENLVVPQNQQFYIRSKVPNNQSVSVQMVPNSNVMVPNNSDVVPNDNVAAQSDNVVSTSEDIEVSSSCVTVIKTIAKTSTSQVNEAYEAEESTKNTSAKTNDSSTSTFVSQVVDAIID